MKTGPSVTDETAVAVAARLRDILAARQWRKARDEAKEWTRRDRTRFLPFLIEANVGLVRDMIAKNLRSEAASVLAYLKTIAPAELVTSLQAELDQAGKSPAGAGKPAPASGTAAPARPKISLKDIAGFAHSLAAGQTLGQADWKQVDALVLEFNARPAPEGDEAELQVHRELAAVLAACDAVGAGDFPAALEALRPLPLKSVFQHWKSFLRAVIAAHQGEREKAQRGFYSLAPSQMLSNASQAYLLWLDLPPGPGSTPAHDSQKVTGLLALSGNDHTRALPILKAEAAWRNGRLLQCYQELCAGWKGAFPVHATGLLGSLTDLVLRMRGTNQMERDQLFDYVCRQINQKSFAKSPDVELALLRWLVLNNELLTMADFKEDFARFLILHARQPGFTPQREAAARTWLGNCWAMEAPVPPQFLGKAHPGGVLIRQPQLAQREFEHAIRLAPDHPKAYLLLCRLLHRLQKKAERTKLLDEMRRRFPKDKQVLALAGKEALDRKDWPAALEHLAQARQIDPHDEALLDDIVRGTVGHLYSLAGKEKPETLDPLWQGIEPLLQDGTAAGSRARWMVRVAQGIIRQGSAGKESREEGVRLAPHPLAALYHEWFLRISHGKTIPKDWSARWAAALPQSSYDALVNLLAVNEYWTFRERDGAPLFKAQKLLEEVLRQCRSKKPATGVLDLAHFLVTGVNHENDGFHLLCDTLLDGLHRQISGPGSKPAADPHLRLALALLDEVTMYEDARYDPAKFLTKLARDAAAANLPDIAAQAQKLLARYHAFESGAHDFPAGEPEFEAASPSQPTDAAAKLAMLIYTADAKTLKDVKKDLVDFGLPGEAFDELVQIAETGPFPALVAAVMRIFQERQSAAAPAPAPKMPKVSRKTAAPDQMDLF